MAPRKRATHPYGKWNTARILCKGSVIEHWLNEETVLSFDYTDLKWSKEVELLRIRAVEKEEARVRSMLEKAG